MRLDLRVNSPTLSSLYKHNGGPDGWENNEGGRGKVEARPLKDSAVNIFLDGGDNSAQIEPSLCVAPVGLLVKAAGGGAGSPETRMTFEEADESWPFEETSHTEARSLISPLRPQVSQLTVLLDFTPQV